MMDSFELNKIMGAILGTLLITLALNIVAGGIFAPYKPAKPGFDIAVTEAPTTAAGGPAEKEQPIETYLAKASVEKGATISKKCLACHDFTKGGPNKVGPNLYGIVGRPRASHEGFAYSAAMSKNHDKWTIDELSQYLSSPRAMVPGTAMAFAGISKPTERADLLAYLNTLSDNLQPLPTAPAGEQKAAAPQGQGEQKNAPPAQGDGQPKAAAPAPAPQGGQPKAAPAPAPKQ